MLPVDPKVELTRQWLRKASGDLTKADVLLASSPSAANVLDGAVFFCQQAAEKALKGFLTWHDQPVRKTHDLRALVQACEAVDPALSQLRLAAEVLMPYLSEFRYPGGDEQPAPEAARDALDLARDVFELVVARLPEAAQP